MIEISDKKYWIKGTYDDAIMYCQFLEIDGKKDYRLFNNDMERMNSGNTFGRAIWYFEDPTLSGINLKEKYLCVPVRDIDHD